MKPERKAPAGTITGMPALDTTWQTPPELLEPVRAYFGGAIPFDAASAPDNPTGAVEFCDGRIADNDGLTVPWRRAALLPDVGPWGVFVNPPYGRVLRDWLAKMAEEARRGVTIIALLPCARWEQGYFQETLAAANAMCFIRKRVAFIRPSTGDRVGGNPYANMFLGFNVDDTTWQRAFGAVGLCVQVGALGPVPAAPRRVSVAPRPQREPGSTERPGRYVSLVPEDE